MNRERLITGGISLALALFAVVLWRDYLHHSSQVYGERDAANAELAAINDELAQATDDDDFDQLTLDRTAAAQAVFHANQQIDDMDGWESPVWKVKNALRLASPAVAALFAMMFVLSILQPLRSS
jgi:hypothetical protein